MTSIGYALSSEEHRPADLVRHARLAEDAGFEFALISDHFHPWIDRQGQSPFVWSVLGGIAAGKALAVMSEDRSITPETIRKEHLQKVNVPAHWLYVAGVLGLSFLTMLAFIAFLGAGSP